MQAPHTGLRSAPASHAVLGQAVLPPWERNNPLPKQPTGRNSSTLGTSAESQGHRERPRQTDVALKYKFNEGNSKKIQSTYILQQVRHAREDQHLLWHGGSLQILTVSGLFSLQRPRALSLVRHKTGRSCVPLPQLTEHCKETHQLNPSHPLETMG